MGGCRARYTCLLRWCFGHRDRSDFATGDRNIVRMGNMQSDVLDRPYTVPEAQVQPRPAVPQSGVIQSASVWGWLPALSVVAALGLVVVALSDLATSRGA